MKLKSKVELKGSKKSGWIITISDNIGFNDDIAVTHEELVLLFALLKKRL